MNSFMRFFLLFTLVAYGAAASISLQLDGAVPQAPIQPANSWFLLHNSDHSAKAANVVTSIYIPPNSTPTPTPVAYQQQQPYQESNSSWAATHPATLIVLFTFTPIIACIVLYPLLKYMTLKRAARRTQKNTAKLKEQEKIPDSPYLNNPRLDPVPVHPQMVYVPHGTRSIFGHFRSPSGRVFGVTDRWAVADKAGMYDVESTLNKPFYEQTLLVRPI